MDFKKLIYKQNDADNTMRISKTKVITIIVFIIFFAWSFPDFLNDGLLSALFTAILVGLIMAIPTFVVGWIIGKILEFKQNKIANNDNKVVKKTNSSKNLKTESKKVNDNENETFAKNFKLFWETQRFVEAKDLCEDWVKKFPKDINCLYAVIIVNATMDTIPNSELNNSFSILKQQRGSELTYWYRDMAERAINYQAAEQLRSMGLFSN